MKFEIKIAAGGAAATKPSSNVKTHDLPFNVLLSILHNSLGVKIYLVCMIPLGTELFLELFPPGRDPDPIIIPQFITVSPPVQC